MTLTLDKLRALKRQAGATDVPAPAASPVPSALREPTNEAAAPVAPWEAVLGEAASRATANRRR